MSVHKQTDARIAELAQVSADALTSLNPVSAKTGQFTIGFSNAPFDTNRVVPPPTSSKDVDGDGVNDLSDSSIAQPRSALPATQSQRGVIVTATNADDIAEFVVGAGIGSGFTFGVSTPATILRVDTTAEIGDGAKINTNNQSIAASGQSVLVAAGNDLAHTSLSGALALGGSGAVAPAGNVASTKLNTTAAIGDAAIVAAKQDVVVAAHATEDALMISAAGAGSGSFGGSGSVAVFKMENKTYASIGAGADVDAGGNVVVSASDNSDLDNIAGAAAYGAGAGVGASVGVNVIHKDTQAFIANDANVDAQANGPAVGVVSEIGSNALSTTSARGVIVQATSNEDLLNIVAAGAAGGFSGAGSLSVNVIDSDTTAFVGDRARINQAAGANLAQSVHVVAGNQVKGRSITGGLAIGAASFAGAGDIGVVRNDTTTFVGNAAAIKANNDIVIHSLAKEEIDSLGVSGGFAGSSAFAAAATVWTIGTRFDATYSDDSSSTNALSNGSSTVDQQATNGAGNQRSALNSVLGNYSGVNNAPVLNPTPSQRIAAQLRGNRQSISSEVSTGSQLTADLFASDDAVGTVAEVRSGAVLDAGDDVSVRASSDIELNTISGSAAGAAAFALGAAVTVERTQMKTDVLFAGTIDRADVVVIGAQSNNDTTGRGFSANGSIGGALGAVVTSIRDTGTTTARIDGTTTDHAAIEQAGQVNVSARSSTNLTATTGQGAIAGIAAAGVTVTKALADGQTSATLGDHVDIGQESGKTVGALAVLAKTNTHTSATGVAIQAGIGVAAGLNFATAQATPAVAAELGATSAAGTVSNARVKVAGGVQVESASNTSSAADMFGLQLAGGASLGFSRATAIVSPEVNASVGQAARVEADGDVTIDAIHNRPVTITLPGGGSFTTQPATIARAEAGGAAAIAGNTAQAIAESNPVVAAVVADDAFIATPALVRVQGESNNQTQALSEALTVGLASAGGVETTATNQGSSQASLGFNTQVSAGNVIVQSTSIDRVVASGTAASGGIVSGNGVTAAANALPSTRTTRLGLIESVPNSAVQVNGAVITATGNVTIRAIEEVDVDAFAKGISIAAGFAAGESEATVAVRPLLESTVSGSTITATGNVLVSSQVGDLSNPNVRAMTIEEGDAVAKDEISTAFAKGSGGALISSIGSDASTTFRPVADANVRQSTINGNDVTISAEDDSSAVAIARNFSAGLVARGRAEATLDMKDDLSAEVGGTSESGATTINALRNFTLKSESDQDGDAFANTRAIAGFPAARAATSIRGDFDLSAEVGQFTDVHANNIVLIQAQAEDAEFGSQQSTEPGDPSNVFGRPNYFGANANSDAGGFSSDASAAAISRLGTSSAPATATTSVGSFSKLTAPTVTISSDVQNISLQSDASAHSSGAKVDVSSSATGEVHSFTRLNLNDQSIIDATTVNLSALNGSTSTGIRSEVESTTDKDGLSLNPIANGTTRMDTDSTIDARNGSMIRTRNLNVLADVNVTQFDLLVKENDSDRAGGGTQVSSFVRDRAIHWNADLVLKGAASPTLVVEQDSAGNALVTTATGVTIQDTDGATAGPVAAATIIVNPINNTAPYGNIALTVPRRESSIADTGVIDGNLGSVTVERGFDEVNLINRSSKPMTVGNINPLNLTSPQIVVDAPNSAVLSFPVFQNFGDTKITIENSVKSSAQPVLTINGVINNPVGETTLKGGSIAKTGSGKIVTNVADIRSTAGSIGSATRLPIEIVVSDGRQESLLVNSASSISLDLLARKRQIGNASAPIIDTSNIVAATTNNLLLHTTVLENNLPSVLPLLRVNEVQEVDITDVVSFFETPEEIINLDLGALGTGATSSIPSTWDFDLLAGAAITVNLDATQVDGPLLNIVGNTDIGTGVINVANNGNVQLSETAGPMRLGAISTTRGDVTLNSNNSIVVSPVDASADVVGNVVNLNAATTIGVASAPVDVNSGNRLNANAAGDIFLVETEGNANVGQISSSSGNVTLSATTGSILDAEADASADVVGRSITLIANNTSTSPAPGVGTASDALELNSSVGSAGVVRAVGAGDVNLVESSGAMTLVEARSATGNIRISVPDTAGTGSDLTLSAAQVVATSGSVQLSAGDNLTATPGTVVQGTLIGMAADLGDADPGVGSTVNLAGSFSGRPITLATGTDADNVTLNQTSLQGQTNLTLDAGNDTLTLDRLAPLTTAVGTLRDTLSVNLGAGAHQVTVNSSATGNFIAPIAATRGTGTNTLTVNGTSGNDVVALNASQAAITRVGSGINELLTYGSTFDRVTLNGDAGNDALAIDIASANLSYVNGVAFNGGAGSDQVTVNGSTQADTFEVDATSATAGSIRTKTGTGPFSAPITISAIEAVGINGQNPTTAPGDRLVILDSVPGIPTQPSGTLVTPLPVTYANIEQVTIGAVPLAVADQFTISEDIVGSFNLFANDTGLNDLPLTISIVQPSLGSVVYNNAGTPGSIADDRFIFTPRANASGTTSFQYTVTDVNGEQSSASVTVVVAPVTDAPSVSAESVSGNEGQIIPLNLKATLVDTDGSETLSVALRGVPTLATLVDADGNPLGIDLGNGVWNLTGIDLSRLFILVRDNGNFDLTLEATASETNRQVASATANFLVTVGNVAPAATIMSAPTDASKDTTIIVQMAATDPSTIDKDSGFTYRINWGDGTPLQVVQGLPGIPPTVEHIYLQNGIYTVTISATDKDGGEGPSTSQVIRIGQSGIVDDPMNPGKTLLVLQGTDASDTIKIKREGNGGNGRLLVTINGRPTATYPIPSSRILVNGLDGDDTIIVDSNVQTNAWLVGGRGRDTLLGGSGDNVLLGGDGDDILRTRQGRDIVMGGRGKDFLFGGSDDDLLNAGTTTFDSSDPALYAIQQEWLRPISVESRIQHLNGSKPGGLNGNRFLIGSGPGQTAFDDGARDVLDNHKSKDWVLVNTDEAIRDLFNKTSQFEELDDQSTLNGLAGGEADAVPSLDDFFLDVDGNGVVTPIDALLVINALNTAASHVEMDTDDLFDVSQDGLITPMDALMIINRLNTPIVSAVESEGAVDAQTLPMAADHSFEELARKRRSR